MEWPSKADINSTSKALDLQPKAVHRLTDVLAQTLKHLLSNAKPGTKDGNRRKSFCARSRGWTGERGKAARRRWNCW